MDCGVFAVEFRFVLDVAFSQIFGSSVTNVGIFWSVSPDFFTFANWDAGDRFVDGDSGGFTR